MFKHVLAAMDLAPATEALVSSLPGLKDFGTEEITLAHVVKDVGFPVSESLTRVEEIRRRLRTLAERLEDYGFRVNVEVATGAAAPEIARLSANRGADLILVGSRSHGRLYEAFVGSVAWEVVRSASVPVLLQRIEASRPDPESALETRSSGLPDRVLHPTDFSPMAERCIPWLTALAGMGVRNFTLLHVIPVDAGDDRSALEARLEELAGRLRAAGAEQVDVEVRRGVPSEEILARGGRNPHTLVVMGTQGRGFLPELVLGSQSRRVVREAAAPVLLVQVA